jgi:hypothetical protein
MSTTGLSPAPPRTDRLRTALLALAALEAGYALLQSLKLVASDVQIGSGRLSEIVTTAHLIVAPLLAIAAVVFAARDRLPLVIMALAAIVLTTWASEAATAHDSGVALVLTDLVRPVLAILAIVLAVSRTGLVVAALLVASLWPVWLWHTFLADVLRFVLGVMIYGA